MSCIPYDLYHCSLRPSLPIVQRDLKVGKVREKVLRFGGWGPAEYIPKVNIYDNKNLNQKEPPETSKSKAVWESEIITDQQTDQLTGVRAKDASTSKTVCWKRRAVGVGCDGGIENQI